MSARRFGSAAGFHPPNLRSSSGRSVAGFTSPTTTSTALFGRTQLRCQTASWSPRAALVEATVPVMGKAQGWPSPNTVRFEHRLADLRRVRLELREVAEPERAHPLEVGFLNAGWSTQSLKTSRTERARRRGTRPRR